VVVQDLDVEDVLDSLLTARVIEHETSERYTRFISIILKG
jgi:hypothetical protein